METKRSNEAREAETRRNNMVVEAENYRSHTANEALTRQSIAAQNYATAQNAANVLARIAADKAMQAERLHQEYELKMTEIAARNPWSTLVTAGSAALTSGFAAKAVSKARDWLTSTTDTFNSNYGRKSGTKSSVNQLYTNWSNAKTGVEKFTAMSNAMTALTY